MRASTLLVKLRKFWLALFEATRQNPAPAMSILVEDSESEQFLYSFTEVLSDVDTSDFQTVTHFPASFFDSLVTWIRNHEDDGLNACSVSFIELSVALLRTDPMDFPHRNPTSGLWELVHPGNLFTRPTLVHYLRIVQTVCKYAFQFCDPNPSMKKRNRSNIGIMMPVDGLLLRLKPAILAHVHANLVQFTSCLPCLPFPCLPCFPLRFPLHFSLRFPLPFHYFPCLPCLPCLPAFLAPLPCLPCWLCLRQTNGRSKVDTSKAAMQNGCFRCRARPWDTGRLFAFFQLVLSLGAATQSWRVSSADLFDAFLRRRNTKYRTSVASFHMEGFI